MWSKPAVGLSWLFTILLITQSVIASAGFHDAPAEVHDAIKREVEARQADLDAEHENLFGKRQSGFKAVTGVRSGIYPRLEIRELERNADQLTLYTLALQRMMERPNSDKFSYYQIAGIHGREFQMWDSVRGIRSSGGYCPHSANIFLPWHRPYLALFEQLVIGWANTIANEYPSNVRARYRTAASTLRMPYWDWAAAPANGNTVPNIVRASTIRLNTPTGSRVINNPFFSYRFTQRPAALGSSPFNQRMNTLRHPTSNAVNAASNNNEFLSDMNRNRVGLRDRLYRLFTQPSNFMSVGTSCVGNNCGNTQSHDSFESTHDAIHAISGGSSGGHMYYVDFSAFDPIFWLHHTNVDRHFAMYRYLQPNSYVTNGALTQNNYVWNRGDVKNAFSDLLPFHKDTQGRFWNSQDVAGTRILGYVYREISGSANAASVRNDVNRLYGPNASGRVRRRQIPTTGYYYGGNSTYGNNTSCNATEPIKDYTADFIADKHAMGGSYNVYVFLGNYSAEVSQWFGEKSYCGLYSVFAPLSGGDSGVTVTGQIPLNTALISAYDAGQLDCLDDASITKYIKENLHWEVVKAGYEVVPPTSCPGLEVAVSRQAYTPSRGTSDFPIYHGIPEVVPDCTSGKPAGYSGPKRGRGYFDYSKPSTAPPAGYPEYAPPPVDYPIHYENGPAPVDYNNGPDSEWHGEYPSENPPPYDDDEPDAGEPTGTYTYSEAYPAPTGFCADECGETVIKYVDEHGQYLYEEMQPSYGKM